MDKWHLSGRNLVESLVENLIKPKGTLPSKGEKTKKSTVSPVYSVQLKTNALKLTFIELEYRLRYLWTVWETAKKKPQKHSAPLRKHPSSKREISLLTPYNKTYKYFSNAGFIVPSWIFELNIILIQKIF